MPPSEKHHLDAYTLNRRSMKLYIISSPILQHAALREERNLSLVQAEVMLIERMCDVRPEVYSAIAQEDHGRWPYLDRFLNATKGALNGAKMTEMTLTAADEMAGWLNSLDGEFETRDLCTTFRNVFTRATAVAIYGEDDNPIFPPSLSSRKTDPGTGTNGEKNPFLAALWHYNRNFIWLYPAYWPEITAPLTCRARKILQQQYLKWYGKKYDLDQEKHHYAHARASVHRDAGFDDESVAKLEVTLLHGATTNTGTTLSWFLMYVFAHPDMMARIAEEATALITTTAEPGAVQTNTLDVGKLTTHCPILVATWNEVLRLENNQVTPRIIRQDTVLSDGERSYLFKAGNTLGIVSGLAHRDPAIWGPDAHEFKPERLLGRAPMWASGLPVPTAGGDEGVNRKKRKEETEQEKLQRLAFMPFSGGRHICPGRMFPFHISLAMAAALCVGWEAESLDGGLVKVPEGRKKRWQNIGEAQPSPTVKVGLRLRRRKGMEGARWKFVKADQDVKDNVVV